MSDRTSIITASSEKQLARAIARSEVYLCLARSFMYPQSSLMELLPRTQQAAKVLGADTLKLLRQLEFPSLAELETQYIRVFGHTMSPDLPPYEMEYGQGDLYMQSHVMAELATFYKTFGAEAGRGERLDHIGTELEFMYFLSYRESYALASDNREGAKVCHDGQRYFLGKHLGCWLPQFLGRLAGESEGFYHLLARVTLAWLEREINELGAHPKVIAKGEGSDMSLSSLLDFAESPSPCEVEE